LASFSVFKEIFYVLVGDEFIIFKKPENLFTVCGHGGAGLALEKFNFSKIKVLLKKPHIAVEADTAVAEKEAACIGIESKSGFFFNFADGGGETVLPGPKKTGRQERSP
jgi:hypothetical protein